MAVEFTLAPLESKHTPLLNDLHKSTYGVAPKGGYYFRILQGNGPSYAAVNSDKELIGFIATKVKYPTSEIYVASLALEEDYKHKGIELELIRQVLKDARKFKAKEVTMHTRESNKDIIKAFKTLKFKVYSDGTYKDGENKCELVKQYKNKKSDFKLKDKPMKHKYAPHKKPEPKEGVFKIREVLLKDIWKVHALHNKTMIKQRENKYFNKLSEFDPCYFWVAVDSNDDLIGYAVARPQRISGLKEGPYTRLNFVSMAVEEKWRGVGIAQLLIDDLFTAAKKNKNIEYVYGHVRGSNTVALRLYGKMGFGLKRIGTYDDDDVAKVLLIRRFRFPSVKPYWLKYREYVKWFTVGFVAHEVVHSVRDYD